MSVDHERGRRIMAEIRETDLMLVCLEAGRGLVKEYNQEVNDALARISDTMYQHEEEIVVTRSQDNPVDRDIATRATLETIKLIMQVEGWSE